MYLTQPSRRDTAHIHHTMKYFGIFLCSSLLMTSCATVFCGSKAKVTFDSDIAEKATLTIDGRKYTNVTFPYTTKIRRGFNAVSVINLLNILGWGIDAATGAMTKPEFKFYQIDFQPKEEKSIKQD